MCQLCVSHALRPLCVPCASLARADQKKWKFREAPNVDFLAVKLALRIILLGMCGIIGNNSVMIVIVPE